MTNEVKYTVQHTALEPLPTLVPLRQFLVLWKLNDDPLFELANPAPTGCH